MEELSKVAYINAIRLIKTSGPKTCKLQEWHQQHVLNLVRVLEPKPEITMIRIHSKAVEVVLQSLGRAGEKGPRTKGLVAATWMRQRHDHRSAFHAHRQYVHREVSHEDSILLHRFRHRALP